MKSNVSPFKLAFFGIAAIAAVVVIGNVWVTMNPDHIEGAVIENKERITTSNEDGSIDSKYLVFTDSEVFENTDQLLKLKFNSSDLQGEMKVGATCDLEVIGFRIPIMSMYRNIIEAECTE